MKITAVKCPFCLDIVYSRTRHDFRSCSCNSLSIDGGRQYTKISSNNSNLLKLDIKEIELDLTEKELYEDWNLATDNYGVIKNNE